ncbi:MAG: 4-hydroxybutyrate dehydrogenase [Eubacterium sp.]|nr:4-hydroxybutyrate dehydrogenase [Eubacterium sp.]MDD7210662.1 4-hydroxybutyrate dehydrogenase [Lachnospiraceae bacterium]MDY5497711.1 4-hydroxybutyrate dehydrogenase [Anaerobutyricum sp.]
MEQIIFRPKLYKFSTCKEFAENFQIGSNDLVLTNRYIFEPFFDEKTYPVQVIFQEEFGSGEPTDTMVDAIIKKASEKEYDRIIAIGGGTVIDIAKILAVTEGECVDVLYDNKDRLERKHHLVAIPTTCGTGSEMTNIAIVNRTRMGVKMGLTSESMFANEAVLIPELLSTLPFGVFATSSIDALVHAVESSLSPKATSYTKLFGYKAIELLITSYQKLVKEGKEILPEIIEDVLTASNYAGLAFGTAGCAAVHALSYPLGGTYHVPHGESNYAMFTGVLKNYMEIKTDGEIAVMNQFLAKLLGCDTDNVYDELESLLNHVLPKKALHEYGVKKEELDTFTDSVMETQGRLMANNFVPLDRDRVYKIYSELY